MTFIDHSGTLFTQLVSCAGFAFRRVLCLIPVIFSLLCMEMAFLQDLLYVLCRKWGETDCFLAAWILYPLLLSSSFLLGFVCKLPISRGRQSPWLFKDDSRFPMTLASFLGCFLSGPTQVQITWIVLSLILHSSFATRSRNLRSFIAHLVVKTLQKKFGTSIFCVPFISKLLFPNLPLADGYTCRSILSCHSHPSSISVPELWPP